MNAKKSYAIISSLLILFLNACSAERKGCLPPPDDFLETDLVGIWWVGYVSSPRVDDYLEIRADGTYKQTIYLEHSSIPSVYYESDWLPWWIEYFDDGIPYLHLEGLRLCAHDPSISCDQVGGGEKDWNAFNQNEWYDYCRDEWLLQKDEGIVLVLGAVYDDWTDDGIELAGLSATPLDTWIYRLQGPDAFTQVLEDSLSDKSILTAKPCEAPCWYGLETGFSTRTDVINVISSLSFINPDVVVEKPWGAWRSWDQSQQELTPTTLLFGCTQSNAWCASIEFVDDVVVRITLFPRNYPLTFEKVVSSLGKPEYFQIFYTQPEEQMDCDISLEWTNRNIEIYSKNVDWELCSQIREDRVVPNLLVHEIIYSDARDITFIQTPESGRDFPWAGFAQP